MSQDQRKLLEELQDKIGELKSFCRRLYDKNLQLMEDVKSKDAEIGELSSKLEDITVKYESLKLVKALSTGEGDEVKQAKVKISKLVHDVDKCISMLKN